MGFDFSNLNDKDIEELVCDILSVKLNKEFQSFKSGKDKGIDLRHSTAEYENDIIVQVKHYQESGISNLMSVLKKQEAAKVINLKPNRYIFVTTLALGVKNKEDIKNVFTPYISSTNDVLGKQFLNTFLRKHHDIVENHFKLWLTSTAVLKRILENGIKGRSEFTSNVIRQRIKRFVPSKTHNNAVEILNKNNFLLITGEPSIGKTTLANFLTYQFLAEGFELVYVREIREAEDNYTQNKKQIFYFDDFLGATTLNLKSSSNADSAMVDFIERVKIDKTKKLILTCRTIILNKTKQISEKIDNSKIQLSNHEISIKDYRYIDKARILYNHIYYSNISIDLKEIFFQNQFHWKVIKHKNYNPRIVEFFTDEERLQPNKDYSEEVIDFLENPSKIWEKYYCIQISHEARLFIATLFSLGGKYVIQERTLQEAFDARLQFEKEKNNYTIITGTFNRVVKELIGGFICKIHQIEETYSIDEYRFVNPSIEDFLYYYYSSNIEEYFQVLKSSISLDQFKYRITTKFEINSKKIFFNSNNDYKKLLEIFFGSLPNIKDSGSTKDLGTVIVLIRHFKWQDIKEKVIELMNDFYTFYLSWDERDNLIEFLEYITVNNLINQFSFNIKDLMMLLSSKMNNYYQIEALSELISKQEYYSNLISDSQTTDIEFYNEFQSNINESWKSNIGNFIEQTTGLKGATEKEDIINLVNKRKLEAKKINETLNLEDSPIIEEYLFNLDSQLEKNIKNQQEQEIQIKTVSQNENDIEESIKINKLFNSDSNNSWDDLPF